MGPSSRYNSTTTAGRKTRANMWNKFLKEEHRTTNLAEAFHSSFQKELCKHGKNPPVSAVLEILQETQLLRYYDLVRWQRGTFDKKLRPEDKQRREAIDKAMKDFDDLRKNSDPSEDDIFKYLDNLSRFLSRKCF